jgi:NADP-dependent 3-hydroxy acid dehydrogenase YdfG
MQSGEVVYPLFGGYSASKFGMEAVADCLRTELSDQGIKVIVIQPGPVKSNIW